MNLIKKTTSVEVAVICSSKTEFEDTVSTPVRFFQFYCIYPPDSHKSNGSANTLGKQLS